MTTSPLHFAKRHTISAKGATPAAKHHADLIQQSQKWVSQTFFGTMLKQMRNSPFKSEMFSGGRGGEAFSEMFDQKLADHMGKGSGKKLVNALVRHMEGAHGAKAARAAKTNAPPIATALRAYAQHRSKAGVK
jgi:Rod binding domain-containing protein